MDFVLAIVITIIALGFKVPEETQWNNLQKLIPTFLSYL